MAILQNFTFDKPCKKDGWDVARLIKACPPLDQNSVYCNLLQCHHFADTSVAAKQGNELAGFVSGYVIPNHPNTLFVWQVAVSDAARGMGLASRMVKHILERKCCHAIQFIETTITESNKASWGLFQKLAESFDSPLTSELLFDQKEHFSGHHDSEFLVKIGPILRENNRTD